MGAYKNNKQVEYIFLGKKAIAKVCKGARLVWEAVRSCFGSGWWINDKPWVETEGWKN